MGALRGVVLCGVGERLVKAVDEESDSTVLIGEEEFILRVSDMSSSILDPLEAVSVAEAASSVSLGRFVSPGSSADVPGRSVVL